MAKTKTFYLAGNETITYLVTRALKAAGLRSVPDVKLADVVFTYFTFENELEDAYFDSEGLVQLAQPGTCFVDLSPTSPHFANELFAVASVSDLHFVAAPIAVIDPVAEDVFARENVMAFVGGEALVLERVRPLIEAFAVVHEMADCAEAQMTRAAHTVTQSARLVAAVEAEALFSTLNVTPIGYDADLGHAMAALPADETRAAVLAAVAAKQFAGDYTVEMMLGEMMAALTAADDIDLILPQLEAAAHLVELLTVVTEGDMAPAALSLFYVNEDEAKRNGIDWSRMKELFADECDCEDDECGCGCEHEHEHGHAHEGWHVHAGGRVVVDADDEDEDE